MTQTEKVEKAEKVKKVEEHTRSGKHDKNGASHGDVKFHSMMPLEEAVSYFEAIISGLKKGAVCFKQGDQNLQLEPPSYLAVEVRAGRKKGKEKISFEIEWQCAGDAQLTISAE